MPHVPTICCFVCAYDICTETWEMFVNRKLFLCVSARIHFLNSSWQSWYHWDLRRVQSLFEFSFDLMCRFRLFGPVLVSERNCDSDCGWISNYNNFNLSNIRNPKLKFLRICFEFRKFRLRIAKYSYSCKGSNLRSHLQI